MRLFLAAAALSLSGILAWILLRPAAGPAAPAAAPPREDALPVKAAAGADGAADSTPPEMEREALPSAEERRRAELESLPHGSVHVRIQDPFGALAEPFTVRLELVTTAGRNASGTRTADERGDCSFDLVPAGRGRLLLVQEAVAGRGRRTIHEREFELKPDQRLEPVLDLGEMLVQVIAECADASGQSLESFSLHAASATLAIWDCDDPGAGAIPGELRCLLPLGETLEALVASVEAEFVATRRFDEPGSHRWRVEPPAGTLHIHCPPSGGLDRIIVEPAPETFDAHRPKKRMSSFAEDGRATFLWLPPGNYDVRAGTMVHGEHRLRAQAVVEVGKGPVSVELEPQVPGSLRFSLPEVPGEDHAGGVDYSLEPKVAARLLPRGRIWPVIAGRNCPTPADCQFPLVLAGDYDLVVERRGWVSITPVTVAAGAESSAEAGAWTRTVQCVVVLGPVPWEFGVPASVELTSARGGTAEMWRRQDRGSRDGLFCTYSVTGALPGPASVVVTEQGGRRSVFEIVITSEETDPHELAWPPR